MSDDDCYDRIESADDDTLHYNPYGQLDEKTLQVKVLLRTFMG